jgi:hypothetical protein
MQEKSSKWYQDKNWLQAWYAITYPDYSYTGEVTTRPKSTDLELGKFASQSEARFFLREMLNCK